MFLARAHMEMLKEISTSVTYVQAKDMDQHLCREWQIKIKSK